jgi:hypothetical protein
MKGLYPQEIRVLVMSILALVLSMPTPARGQSADDLLKGVGTLRYFGELETGIMGYTGKCVELGRVMAVEEEK